MIKYPTNAQSMINNPSAANIVSMIWRQCTGGVNLLFVSKKHVNSLPKSFPAIKMKFIHINGTAKLF